MRARDAAGNLSSNSNVVTRQGQGGGTNLAAGKPITASSHVFTFVDTNANDNDVATYWESGSGAYPATLTVNLGAKADLTFVVVKLNPDAAWATRAQTIEVLGRSSPKGRSRRSSRPPPTRSTRTAGTPSRAGGRHRRRQANEVQLRYSTQFWKHKAMVCSLTVSDEAMVKRQFGHRVRLVLPPDQVAALNAQAHAARALWNLLHDWWTMMPRRLRSLAAAEAAIRQARATSTGSPSCLPRLRRQC